MGNQCEPCIESDPNETQQLQITNAIKSDHEYYDVEVPASEPFFVAYLKQSQWARTGNRKLRKNFRINRYYYGDWGGGTPQGRGILYEPGKILIDANFSSGVPGSPAKIIFINKNSEYEGELEGGKINGKGTMINHAEMYSFSGEWKDSEPQKGSLILTKDKNIQRVEFIDFKSRISRIHYRDGRIYEGEIDWKRLTPEGKGKVKFGTFDVKDFYQGQWKNGLYEGQGTFQWKNGQSYIGLYRNGLKNGQGRFKFLTGNEYEGGWLNGKQHGAGIIYDKNGFKLKQGQWNNGNFVGPDRFHPHSHPHSQNYNHSPYKNGQQHPHSYNIGNQNQIHYNEPSQIERISEQFLGQNIEDIMQFHVSQGLKRSLTYDEPRESRQLKMADLRKVNHQH